VGAVRLEEGDASPGPDGTGHIGFAKGAVCGLRSRGSALSAVHARAFNNRTCGHVVRIPGHARSSRHPPGHLAILELDQPTMLGRDVKVGNVRRRARDDEPGPEHLSVARELRTDAVLAVALETILDIAFLLLSPFAGGVLLFAGLIYFLRSSR